MFVPNKALPCNVSKSDRAYPKVGSKIRVTGCADWSTLNTRNVQDYTSPVLVHRELEVVSIAHTAQETLLVVKKSFRRFPSVHEVVCLDYITWEYV